MTWLDVLAASAWKGTMILAAAFLAMVALRRASAAVRHFVWVAAFAALLVLPAALRFAPHWGTPAAPVVYQETQPPRATLVLRSAPPEPARRPVIPGDWWIATWLLGVVGSAIWFGVGRAKLRTIARRAVPAGFADSLPVPVFVSEGAAVPMACGLWRPRVILPPEARDWPAARLGVALAHEWSHIQRRDLHTQVLAQIACCLYWFQPLVWLAARGLRQERERACDDAVLAGGVEAHQYAAELMELARAATHSPLGALAMAERSDLEGRIRALLDRRRNRRPLGIRPGLAITGVFAAILVPMAMLQAQAPAGPALLTGFVHDAAGARVAGASVTAHPTDGAESNQISTRTDAVGGYRFPLLPPGQYLVDFSVPGFAVAKREVTLAAGQTAQLDIALTVGSVQEAIVVKGKRPASPAAIPAGPPRRIRVGGNVQAAKLILQTPPEYPADLQQAGVESSVTIKALISTTGEPMNLEVLSPGGDPRLVRAALDAVRQWRYQPARLNGEPVVIDTQITVDFRLTQ